MTNKWYDPILNAVKSFFGMQTDATEQEIHQALQNFKSLDDFKSSIRAQVKSEIETEMQAKIDDENNEFLKKNQNLEQQLAAANQRATELQTEAADLRKKVEQLTADVKAKSDEIAELKSKPAADLNLGSTGGDGYDSQSDLPVWNQWKAKMAETR